MRKTRNATDRICTMLHTIVKILKRLSAASMRRSDRRPDGWLTVAKDAKSLLKRENGNVDWVVCRIAAQRQKYPMHRPRKVRHTMLSKLERGRTKVVQRPSRFIARVAHAATLLRISWYFHFSFPTPPILSLFPQHARDIPSLTLIASSSGYNCGKRKGNRDICVYIEQISLVHIDVFSSSMHSCG